MLQFESSFAVSRQSFSNEWHACFKSLCVFHSMFNYYLSWIFFSLSSSILVLSVEMAPCERPPSAHINRKAFFPSRYSRRRLNGNLDAVLRWIAPTWSNSISSLIRDFCSDQFWRVMSLVFIPFNSNKEILEPDWALFVQLHGSFAAHNSPNTDRFVFRVQSKIRSKLVCTWNGNGNITRKMNDKR